MSLDQYFYATTDIFPFIQSLQLNDKEMEWHFGNEVSLYVTGDEFECFVSFCEPSKCAVKMKCLEF